MPLRPVGRSTWVMSAVTTTLRAEPDAGQEHLHLLGRGVLRLVEDDEALVERAAPHERQGRDLDRAPLEQALGALGLDHVVERVVQRAQVGVDLGGQVAGQEAEPLAGLDRRAGEDDAVDLLGLQRLHGHGHRQPGLAGAGGADAERDDVLADGVDVALLAGRSWGGPCGPRAERSTSAVSTSDGRSSCADHVDGAHDAGRLEALAPLEQQHQLLEQVPDLVGLVAGDGDLVAPHVDLDAAERGLDDAQQLVALAEEVGHEVVAGDGDLDLSGRHEGTRLRTSPTRAARAPRDSVTPVSPPRRPADLVGPRDGEWAARLERWAAEARVDAAAEARAREQWLRRQAEEEGSLAGVLADLADGGCRCGCTSGAAGRSPGRSVPSAPTSWPWRPRAPRETRGGGGPGSVCSVRTGPGARARHGRPARDPVLAAAGRRPRRPGGRARAGARRDRRRRDGGREWSRSVGQDVATLRTGTGAAGRYVPLGGGARRSSSAGDPGRAPRPATGAAARVGGRSLPSRR